MKSWATACRVATTRAKFASSGPGRSISAFTPIFTNCRSRLQSSCIRNRGSQGVDEIEFPSLSGFHDAAEIHEICGVEFTRLRPAYHFVYLLLHIFRHLLGSWTRLLSLYEVATFIRKRKSEEDVWADAAQIIEKDKC